MRFVLSSVLRHHGFDVIAVADGLACLDCLETLLSRPIGGTRVDLVLIDLHGPLVNGLELLAQLRRIDWATPVILMSTRDGPEIHQEAARLGPAFIVGRSCDLDDLLTAVSYCT